MSATTHRSYAHPAYTRNQAAPINGSALLDALIATALLLASAMLAAQWHRDALVAADQRLQRQQAHAAAWQQLEVLQVHARSGAPLADGQDQVDTGRPTPYRRQWRSAYDSTTGLTQLSVRVDWINRQGRAQSLEQHTSAAALAWLQPRP